MGGLFLAVLPYALGAAVSPLLLTTEILLLSGGVKPRSRSWAFVAGAALVLIAYVSVLAAVLGRLPDAGQGAPSVAEVVIKLGAAAALVLLGLRALRPRPERERSKRFAERYAKAGLPYFVGLGALLMLTNISTIVLLVPLVHELTRAQVSAPDRWAVGAVALVIVMLPLLVPVLAATVAGKAADRSLAAANRFTVGHRRAIDAGLCFFFAAWLAVSGISAWLAL